MSRQSRKPVDIFNFSFLDVIACAVGAVLFVTLMVITQTVHSLSPALQKELQDADSYESTLERMEKEMDGIDEDAGKWEIIETQTTSLTRQLDSLKTELSRRKEVVASIQQQQELMAELTKLKGQVAASTMIERALSKRKPALRETPKIDMITFTFQGGGYMRIIERDPLSSSGFSSAHYDIRQIDNDVVMKANGPGLSIDQALTRGGLSPNMQSMMNSSMHYVQCIITPQGFEDFVRVREALYVSGYEVGVLLDDSTEYIVFGPGGHKAPVQ